MKINIKKLTWLFLIFFLLLVFTSPVFAQTVQQGEGTTIKFKPAVPIGDFKGDMTISNQSIGYYVKAVYKYGVTLGTTLAIVVIMVGGVIWLTSGGSPERVKNARSFIGGAFVGLVLLLGSYLLLQTINPALIDLTLPEITQIEPKELPGADRCTGGRIPADMDRCEAKGDPNNINCGLEKDESESVITTICCCDAPDYCKDVKSCGNYSSYDQCRNDYCKKSTIKEPCVWGNNKCSTGKELPSKLCGDTYPTCNGICWPETKKCEKEGNACVCK